MKKVLLEKIMVHGSTSFYSEYLDLVEGHIAGGVELGNL